MYKNNSLIKTAIIFFIIIVISNLNIFSLESDIEGQIINKIKFKGLKKAKKKDVLSVMETREKTELDLMLVEQDYQKIIGLGYFEDVYISTENAYDEQTKQLLPGMIDLILDCVEKPTIRKVIFKGNKKMSYGFFLEDVTIKRGEFLDLSAVNTNIAAITNKYHQKGYNYVKVDYEIFKNEELKTTNQVDLIFNIDEGMETYVKEIIISGNNNISEFTIKNKLKTKERKYLGLQKGIFVESDFNQDIDDLKKYYKEQGYYLIDIQEPEVSHYEIEENGEKREVISIKLKITEGNQFKYGGMIIEGNKILSTDDLTFSMKLKKGQLFNYTKFQEDLNSLQIKYTDAGYIQTQIADDYQIDNDNKLISVKVHIIESDKSYIEAVYFRGNEKTKNYVLERAITTEVGEIFNSSKLMESIMQLYNLGFFSKVEYDIQQGSSPGLLKITYILEEQLTAEVRFGLQIPANKWPPDLTLFGEITEKNWLGRELQISGKIDASLYKQGFEFSLDDPWFLNFPWSLGASANFYHNWDQKVLRAITTKDYEAYMADNPGAARSSVTETMVRDWYDSKFSSDDTRNKNYLNANGDFWKMGIHNLTTEISTRTGYRFLKYFSVSGNLSCQPIYTFMPYYLPDYTSDWTKDISTNSAYSGVFQSDEDKANGTNWSVRAKLSTTFAINTTLQRVNPYEGIRFSLTAGYIFGTYDNFVLSSKFTAYLKLLDINFNDWSFKNVLVFNFASSLILPGFRDIAPDGYLNGKKTYGAGPIIYPSDYLTVDGLFAGRGWGNSIGASSYSDRFTDKIGYVRLDASLEYRLPIYEKMVWLAAFVDMVNLIEGPFTWKTVSGVQTKDTTNSWIWWKTGDSNYQPLGIDNWYGSIGVGLEITFPQLPLSFFIVKRFKINYYSGFEWVGNQPSTGNLDFVLSIVGFYF